MIRLLRAYRGLKLKSNRPQLDFEGVRLLRAYRGLKHSAPRGGRGRTYSLLRAYRGLKREANWAVLCPFCEFITCL